MSDLPSPETVPGTVSRPPRADRAGERRPTILVGYGAFGLDALRRLLAGAALRGTLGWEEPVGGARPSERRLRDLAPLWLPDSFGLPEQQTRETETSGGSSLEIMRDLYRQIHRVELKPAPEEGFAKALEAAARRLLSATSRASRGGTSPLGLDVIVLARPTHPEVLGTLDLMLRPGLGRLAANPNLVRAVASSTPLSFLEILDFDHYWDDTAEARRLREAVSNSARLWQGEARSRRPALRRIYLADGRTGDGIRDAQHRLDEITLFLELMLFEGQRGELQHLWQAAAPGESPVATFGVRRMERGTGLLSRLAAAHFGSGWLHYLAGDGEHRAAEPRPPASATCLSKYRPAALDGLLDAEPLRRRLEEGLSKLEEELLSLPPEPPEWPRQAVETAQTGLERLRGELSSSAGHRMVEIHHEHLAKLAEEVRAAIETDLHDPHQPASLGAVIRELEDVLRELNRDSEPALPEGEGLVASHRGWSEIHGRYRRFREERIQPRALATWWPLYALALTAGLTPVARDLIEEALAFLSPPDPVASPWLWVHLHGFLIHLAHPTLLAALVLGAAVAVGHWGLQRPLAKRTERGLAFFRHPQRGRFSDRIRASLAPGGELRRQAESFLDRLLRDMSLAVHSEVRRELQSFVTRLRERRREMAWLTGQLRQFLAVHGVDPEAPVTGGRRAAGRSTGIRDVVERPEDLSRMLEADPPGPARFRSAQSTEKPFAGWQEPWCDAFLYPLHFIDRLAERYRDPFEQELTRPEVGPEQEAWVEEFLGFVRRRASFDLAFSFTAGEGVPPVAHFCLLPPLWRRLPGVMQSLADHRIGEEQVLHSPGVARAYLLRLTTGIDPNRLEATP